jgi:hypothetical protein
MSARAQANIMCMTGCSSCVPAVVGCSHDAEQHAFLLTHRFTN